MDELEIGRRVEQILASIKKDWRSSGLVAQEYWFPATAEVIIETHIRAAIVVGLESSIESLMDEIITIKQMGVET